MKAVIMAGGFGTRLRPLTNSLPKPMVPIANRPIMEYIIDLLSKEGIKDMVSLLYFYPEIIEEYFGDGSSMGVKMQYVGASEDFGTAGSVRNAKSYIDGPFIVMSGDVMIGFDLSLALKFHRKKKALATIVLTRVDNPLPFGIVITDEKGRIVRFLEKPSWGEVFSDTINTGIYILEPRVFDYIPEESEFDFSKDLFPLLLKRGEPLYGYIAEGYWKDIGGLKDYLLVNLDLIRGKVGIPVPGKKMDDKNVWIGKDTKIDFTADLGGSVFIGENSVVRPGVYINNSVIGNNCVIETGAKISDSVLWDGVLIGKEAVLQENIVGKNSKVMDYAFLGEGVVVSDKCHIGRGSRVKANVKVWPHKVVEDGATLSSSLIWGEKWSKSIFGAYGVTGLANIEISPEFAAKLGAAYGASLKKGSTVSTSRDSHKACRMNNRAIMTGILSTGVNVNDYGVIPMPVSRYLTRISQESGGIHSRRSPFDPELIDFKFFDADGLDLHPNREKAVERLFYREDFRRAPIEETGELNFPIHGIESYRNGFLSFIDEKLIKDANFKIVLDYSYGSSASVFPAILGRLKCDVIALNANLDAAKITRGPEEFAKALDQLANIVHSLGADIGVMLDAGGEKIFLVDEKGDIIDGDTALKLVSLLVFKTHSKGTVALPVTASGVIDGMASAYGFDVKRTKISGRSVMEVSSQEGVVFAGEETGGYIFSQFQPAFDGMFSIVKILEMMAKIDVRLHSLLREIPPGFMVKERVACPWEFKGRIMRKLIENVGDGSDVELLDGVKVHFDQDWLVAYPSHDHAYFHVIAESSMASKAEELVGIFVEKIKNWQTVGGQYHTQKER